MNAGRESSCVINPEGNSLLQKWDVFIFLALIYTSVVTPFEVLHKIIFCFFFCIELLWRQWTRIESLCFLGRCSVLTVLLRFF